MAGDLPGGGTGYLELFEMLPPGLEIGVGDTVHWSATGAHTVSFAGRWPGPATIDPFGPATTATSYDGTSFYSSGLLNAGPGAPTSYTLTFPTAGAFPYVCALHQFLGQRGVIAVGQPLPSAAPAGSLPRRPRPAPGAEPAGAAAPSIGDPALAGSDAGQCSYTPPVMRIVRAARYATPLREGGSLPAVIEADDGVEYVVKFRGAGQGTGALIAEVVAGSIARVLGLAVPEIVLVDLGPGFGQAEPDPEIRELLERSPGRNAGLRFLSHALPFRPGVSDPPDAETAAAIVWLDALVTNIDRTPRNPNLLTWQGGLWLIDHGAALYVQHTWRDPDAHARRPFPQAVDHVLLPYAGSLVEADARLAPLLQDQTLVRILDMVPDDWLTVPRERFVSYLSRRLESPRPFLAGAEEARLEALASGPRSAGRDRQAARSDV